MIRNRANSLFLRKPYGKWREKGKRVILPFSRDGSCDFGTRESFWKGKSVILPSRDGSCDFGTRSSSLAAGCGRHAESAPPRSARRLLLFPKSSSILFGSPVMKGAPLTNRAASLSSRKPYGKWREKGKSVIMPFSRDGSCDFGASLSFECALRKSLNNFGRSSVILWKRESS